MSRITVEPGMTLNCEVDDYLWPWQKSEPVVMLHGTARNASFWRRWVPPLAAEHRIYRPDSRGSGGSDTPPEGYHFTTESILGDLRAILDHYGIESAHVIGESSGAMHGVLLAATDPKRVKSLVLCDMPMKIPPDVRAFFAQGEADQMTSIMKIGMAEWAERTVDKQFDVENAPRKMREWWVAEFGKVPAGLATGLMRHHRDSEATFRPLIKQVQVPVLLLAGARSPLSGDQQSAMVNEFPNARLESFAGYGHGINLVAPDECVRATVAFWNSL